MLILRHAIGSEGFKFILRNFGLNVISNTSASLAIQLGSKSLCGLLRFLILRDEALFKEATNSRDLMLLVGSLVSMIITSELRKLFIIQYSHILEQNFINMIMKLESETNCLSIWNNRNPTKSLGLKEIAALHAHSTNLIIDLPSSILAYILANYLTSKYLSNRITMLTLPKSFVLFYISLCAASPTLNYLCITFKKEERAASNSLAAFASSLEKAHYSYIRVSSLIPDLYEKLLKDSTSSLLQYHNIAHRLLDFAFKILPKASSALSILGSAYFGIESFAYQLSSTIVTSFDVDPVFEDPTKYTISLALFVENLRGLKSPLTKTDELENTAVHINLFSSIKLPDGTRKLCLKDGLSIGPGITLIKGPSGCGKTALVNIISGHSDLLDYQCSPYINESIRENEIYNIPASIHAPLPKTTWLAFITGQMDVTTSKFERLGELKNLLSSLKLNDFTSKLDTYIENPSNGELKRMLAAKAIFNKAKLIILDETFSSVANTNELFQTVDRPTDRDEFLLAIKKYALSAGAAIVYVSHDFLYYTENKETKLFADKIIEFIKHDNCILGECNAPYTVNVFNR